MMPDRLGRALLKRVACTSGVVDEESVWEVGGCSCIVTIMCRNKSAGKRGYRSEVAVV